MGRKLKVSWTICDPVSQQFKCTRCGGLKPQPALPISIEGYCKAIDEFNMDHARCEDPNPVVPDKVARENRKDALLKEHKEFLDSIQRDSWDYTKPEHQRVVSIFREVYSSKTASCDIFRSIIFNLNK